MHRDRRKGPDDDREATGRGREAEEEEVAPLPLAALTNVLQDGVVVERHDGADAVVLLSDVSPLKASDINCVYQGDV